MPNADIHRTIRTPFLRRIQDVLRRSVRCRRRDRDAGVSTVWAERSSSLILALAMSVGATLGAAGDAHANFTLDVTVAKTGSVTGNTANRNDPTYQSPLNTSGQSDNFRVICPSDPTAGCDFDETDRVIRTYDIIDYTFDYTMVGGDDTNITMTSTLPANFSWLSLPAFCSVPGSALSNSNRTLTCNIGDRTAGVSESIPFRVRVSGQTNGSTIAIDATVTGDSGRTTTSTLSEVVTVTAAPRWDIRAFSSSNPRSGTVDGESGLTFDMLSCISGTGVWAGIEPPQTPISFQMQPEPGNILLSCGFNSCSQPGGAGAPVFVTHTPQYVDDFKRSAHCGSATEFSTDFKGTRFGVTGTELAANGGSMRMGATFTNFDPISISSQTNYTTEGEQTANNTGVRIGRALSTSFRKSFLNATNGVVGAGQELNASINFSNGGSVIPVTDVQVCDVLDRRHYRLRDETPGSAVISVSPNATVEYANTYVGATPPADDDFYAAGETINECGDPGVVWYPTTTAAGGVDNVTKVRVTATAPVAAGASFGVTLAGRVLVDGAPAGTAIGNHSAFKHAEVSSGAWQSRNYNIPAASGNHNIRTHGATVIIGDAQVSLEKRTDDPNNPSFPDNSVNSTLPGNMVDFVLSPALTSKRMPVLNSDVTVTDVLPDGLDYVSATPVPDSVQADTPAAGQTTLTWTFPNVTPNLALPSITIRTQTGLGVTNGETLLNEAVISSPADTSTSLVNRTSTRGVTASVVQGLQVLKSSSNSSPDPDGSWTYTISYQNRTTMDLTGIEIIDVLPYDGDSRGTSTAPGATLAVLDPTTSLPAGVQGLYSSDAPGSINDDPSDTTNQSGGATTWCAPANFNTGACPSGFADVTAVRFLDTVALPANAAPRSVSFGVQTAGNAPGDAYSNTFRMNAAELSAPVGSSTSGSVVGGVAIGGTLFNDSDNDGVLNATNGDTVFGGVTVELFRDGETPGVNPAFKTATTDSAGLYIFDLLFPGTYFVHVPQASINGLSGIEVSAHGGSAATVSAPDADDDDDGIDDGYEISTGVRSASVGLVIGGEPTTDGVTASQTINSSMNLTVDFGFALQPRDFSDAPLTGTTYGSAEHLLNTAIRMGATVTAENTAYDSANADGDSDDGITIPALTQGTSAAITATVTGAGGYLQGWIDWNGNGAFDAGEQVATDLQDGGALDTDATAGAIAFTVTPPSNAVTTQTFARFRWATTSGLNSTTAASDGEVEDYAVTIAAPTIDLELDLTLAPTTNATVGIPFDSVLVLENVSTTLDATTITVDWPVPSGYTLVDVYNATSNGAGTSWEAQSVAAWTEATGELVVGDIAKTQRRGYIMKLVPTTTTAGPIEAEVKSATETDIDSIPANGFASTAGSGAGGANGEDDEDSVQPSPITIQPTMGQCEVLDVTLLEDATVNANGEYVLTPNLNNRKGFIWTNKSLNLSQSFEIEVGVYLGTDDAGADGIGFILQADPRGTAAQGSAGGGMGVDSLGGATPIIPSIVIEFDTFQNGGAGTSELAQDHTAIYRNGNVFTPSAANTILPATSFNKNIEDGQYHLARFVWNPATQSLSYSFDGVTITTQTIDLISEFGTNLVTLGFSAATGGAKNEQKACFITLPQLSDPAANDYSDAPTSGTSYGDAQHTVTSGIQLGAAIDGETTGIGNANASGDGTDDDGVSAFPTLTEGDSAYTLPVANITVTGTGALHAWLDFDGDGSFETTEYASTSVLGGTLGGDLSWTGQTTTATGTTFARLRLTSDTLTNANAATIASDGEVEDYQVTINSAPIALPPASTTVANCPAPDTGFYGEDFQVGWFGNETLGGRDADIFWNMPSTGPEQPGQGPDVASATDFAEGPGMALDNNGSDVEFSGVDQATAIAALGAGDYVDYSFTTPAGLRDGRSLTQFGYGNNTTTLYPFDVTILVSDDPTFATADRIADGATINGTNGYTFQTVANAGGQNLILSPSTTYYVRAIFYNNTSGSVNDRIQWDDFQLGTGLCADFPDALDTFGVSTHAQPEVPSVFMGASLTTDVASYNSATAVGDVDNGVTIPTLTQGVAATIPVTVAGAGGFLQGWIDWDGNGTFDGGEQIATNLQDDGTGGDTTAGDGTITFSVTPPPTAVTTQTFARFRWSTTSGLDSTTAANDGEVEDYAVTVVAAPTITPSNDVMAYANSGSGAYKSEIAWLNWSNSSLADGIQEGDQVTFPLVCGDGELTATFSNIVNPAGAATYTPFDMQTWPGAWAAQAYNSPNSGEAIYGNFNAPSPLFAQYDITAQIDFTMVRAGQSVIPDLIFVDAESTSPDAGSTSETIRAITNGGAWNSIEDVGGSNYGVSGIGSQDAVITKTFRPAQGPIMLTENASRLTVSLDAHGKQGFAIGVMLPCDRGDAPGYGDPVHSFEMEAASPFGAPGAPAGLQNVPGQLYLGTAEPDAEISISADDNAQGLRPLDEDGITIPALTQGASATITATVTGAGGFLQGWIDWNGNNAFDAGEQVATDLQDDGTGGDATAGDGTITFSVTPPGTAVASTFARFRWSTTSGLNSTAAASDGEVEDYAVTVAAPPNFTGQSGTPATCSATSLTGMELSNAPNFDGQYSAMFTAADMGVGDRDITLTKTAGVDDSGGDSEELYFDGGSGSIWLGRDLFFAGKTATVVTGLDEETYEFTFDDDVIQTSLRFFAGNFNQDGDERIQIVRVEDASGTDITSSTVFEFTPSADSTFDFATGEIKGTIDGNGSDGTLVIDRSAGFRKIVFKRTEYDHMNTFAGPGNDTGTVKSQPARNRSNGYLLNPIGYCSNSSEDYSDAPTDGSNAPDGTVGTSAYGEATHTIVVGLRLGATITDETSAVFDADNASDDGVTFPASFEPATSVTVPVNVTGQGFLNAWIDWNGDGAFDGIEQIATDVQDTGGTGTINLAVTVPADAVVGQTFARFRWSSAFDIGADGAAPDGEVEDYQVTIGDTSPMLSGTLFLDNGVGTAHNGLIDPPELGAALGTIAITDAGGAQIATATVNPDGTWEAMLPVGYSGTVTVAVTPLPAYRTISEDVSGAPGATNPDTTDGTFTFNAVAGDSYAGLNIGLIENPTLTQNQQASVSPGQVIDLPHVYTATTSGMVSFALVDQVANPAGGFASTIFADADCDGVADGALPANTMVEAGQQICLAVRTQAGAGVSPTATLTYGIEATTAFTGTALTDVARNDDTLGSSGSGEDLLLRKLVSNESQAPGVESTSNTGDIGDVLQYRVLMTNPGPGVADNVTVTDATPAYTALSGPIPSPVTVGPGMSCSVTTPAANVAGYAGPIEWDCPGTLAAGAGGSLTFQVTITP